MGSRKSPTLVGGGVIFGPHARSYRQRTPKKMRKQALRIALSDKVREDRLTILDEFDIDGPRTRAVVDLIGALGLRGRTLLVVESNDRDIVLSVRGAEKVDVIFADGLNATSATAVGNIVATRGAVERIESLWNDSAVEAEVA